eukprot:CAMPEP_0184296816 /NCGR_PEP_ID=MMETSP1049-20130417/7778_1 /TAXON_ID=77928 /ORGANISM="Proteomonas sulcata, Strain CCMP704" /LENGTH=198 /DNA_ID=CAMNT_0026606247 /DNA_START=11 /DNA_END=607 /DNA_ORIENTATION=+
MSLEDIGDDQKKLRTIVTFSKSLGDSSADEQLFDKGFPDEAKPLLKRLFSLEPSKRLSAGHPTGLWGQIKSDTFYGGIDFEALPQTQPPAMSSGLVSAVTATDRKWNRRRQSMLYSPMPDKYNSATDGSIPTLPEEPHGTPQYFMNAGPGEEGAGRHAVPSNGGSGLPPSGPAGAGMHPPGARPPKALDKVEENGSAS